MHGTVQAALKMKTKGFQLRVEGSDKTITCQEDESLLVALARQGYAQIPVGCRKGGCGVCKIRVLEGEFKTGKMSIKHVSLQEREESYSLACKTFPKGDLKFVVMKRESRVISNEILGFNRNSRM